MLNAASGVARYNATRRAELGGTVGFARKRAWRVGALLASLMTLTFSVEGALPASAAAKPIRGGTLTLGAVVEPVSYDPVLLHPTANAGGNQMQASAVYDLLVYQDVKN